MPSDVIVTPEILAGQSAEMSSLMAEYESLFTSVSSLLTEINGSWSPNMANNFSGKIQSAQKSFSNVVGMLGNGAAAAKAAAQIYADDLAGAAGGILGLMELNPALSDMIHAGDYEGAMKFLNEKGTGGGNGNSFGTPGETMSKAAGSSSQDVSIFSDEEKQQMYDALPEETKKYLDTAQDVDSWLVKNYEKIPEPARELLEKKLPSEMTNPVSVMHDIYSGEVKSSTLGKTAEILSGSKLNGSIVQASAEAAFNSKPNSLHDASYESARKAHDAFVNGEVGKGIQYTTESLAQATGEGLYRMGDAFLNTAGILLEKSKTPALSKVGSWLHNLL